MKKKVFSVLLTVALATGVLAGCGSSAATGNNAATGAAQNEGSQAASATTAGEESGDTIVIRFLLRYRNDRCGEPFCH